jgi:hypothetical protein
MTTVYVLIAAVVGYWFNELRHRREMGVKIVEIAVGILAGEPDKNKGLRNWAVDALAHYANKAKVPLTEEAKSALRDKPLPLPVTSTMFDVLTGKARGSPVGEQSRQKPKRREKAGEKGGTA